MLYNLQFIPWKKSHPKNLAPTGPISKILEARASDSMTGGGLISFSFFTSLQVTRVGMQALPGGMMIRTPEWRQPRMAPPRASTMKLTRKLEDRAQGFGVGENALLGILFYVLLCKIAEGGSGQMVKWLKYLGMLLQIT